MVSLHNVSYKLCVIFRRPFLTLTNQHTADFPVKIGGFLEKLMVFSLEFIAAHYNSQ